MRSVLVKISGFEPAGIQTFASHDGSRRIQDARRYLEIMLLEHDYRGPNFLEYHVAERDEHERVRKDLPYLRGLIATVEVSRDATR